MKRLIIKAGLFLSSVVGVPTKRKPSVVGVPTKRKPSVVGVLTKRNTAFVSMVGVLIKRKSSVVGVPTKRNASFALLLTGCLFLSISSCKKFLQQEPYNRISVNDIFKDLEGARTTLAGCYENLKETDYYMRVFSVYPEITAGNIKYARNTSQVLFNTYNFLNTPNDNELEGFYRLAYNTIYRANNIFANVNNVTDANALQKNRMRAEAYMFRALAHFDLLRVFAQGYGYTPDASHTGITIKPVNTSPVEPAAPPVSVKVAYDFIAADLDSAINLYGNSAAIYTSGNDRGWFSQDAARALRARVALYRQEWPKVVSLASELISSNKYPLITNSAYINAWKGKTILTESIFELVYGNRTGGSLGDYYNPNLSLTGYLATADDLLNLYAAADVRSRSNLYTSAVRNSVTYYFTKKYQGTADSANNLRLFRLSEIYLSRAEANAETGNFAAALTDLNLVRKRANPAAPNFFTASADTLINEILTERRRELCFEGHTFFDVSRKKKNLVRTDCTSILCSFTWPNDKFACAKPLTP
jgi:starch-binding outer membrane protein, SusD/RagB family